MRTPRICLLFLLPGLAIARPVPYAELARPSCFTQIRESANDLREPFWGTYATLMAGIAKRNALGVSPLVLQSPRGFRLQWRESARADFEAIAALSKHGGRIKRIVDSVLLAWKTDEPLLPTGTAKHWSAAHKHARDEILLGDPGKNFLEIVAYQEAKGYDLAAFSGFEGIDYENHNQILFFADIDLTVAQLRFVSEKTDSLGWKVSDRALRLFEIKRRQRRAAAFSPDRDG